MFFFVLFRNLRKWRSKDSGGCLGEIKLKLCSRGETDKNFKKMGWKTLSHTHQVKKFLDLIHSSLTHTWTVNGPWLLLTKLGERETLFKSSLCCHRQKIGITLSGVAKQTYKQNNKQKKSVRFEVVPDASKVAYNTYSECRQFHGLKSLASTLTSPLSSLKVYVDDILMNVDEACLNVFFGVDPLDAEEVSICPWKNKF